LVGLGVAIALGMLASSVVVSQAVIQIKQENQALEVKGFAEKKIVSDFASWTGSFTTRACASRELAPAPLAGSRPRETSEEAVAHDLESSFTCATNRRRGRPSPLSANWMSVAEPL
jgi:hypothetical protein